MRTRLLALLWVIGCGGESSIPTDAGTPSDGAARCPVSAPSEPGVVAVETGLARGVERGSTWAYLGLPFAAPPTGEHRFRPPEPAACWDGVRDASAFGPLCPQPDPEGTPIGEEDCLSLNVWTPRDATAPLPVLVFMHGGANNVGGATMGVGGVALYDGAALAARGVVVVTLQYRLGVLGFLAHPALDAERASGTSGNWGLRDQIAALAWVQRNIAAFGGDPARVMLFGESAGALDTCLLLTSPLASGLFSRALMQSGGCPATPRSAVDGSAARLVAALDCEGDVLGCLRAATPEQLLRALPAAVDGLTRPDFGPIVDGEVIPRAPLEVIANGAHARVPLVIGTNAHETARMVPPPSAVADEAQFDAAARAFLASQGLVGPAVDRVIAIYPPGEHESPHAALVALSTDVRWTCPTRAILRSAAAAQDAPVWRYFFTQSLDPARAPAASRAGAYHGLELFYVFGSLSLGGYRPTDADLALSDEMQGLWTRFAASGDPNGGGGVTAWPRYDIAADAHLELGTPLRAGAGVRTAQCDALAEALDF